MSDVDISHQEAGATVSDAPIDVDILPSDAEASTSAAGPSRQAGPGRPKGKITTTATSNTGKDAELGIDSFLLPKSTVTKIAKSAVPPNTKLQKEVATALTRSAVVFISYLTSLAQEQAAAAGVKTIKPEHVLDALPELDWGEADTARLRKDLKKQLKAYRRNAKAKKEGKLLPGPSTGRGRGRPPKTSAANGETTVIEDDDDEGASKKQNSTMPEVEVEYKSNGLFKKPASGDEESSDEEDDVNVRQIAGEDGDEAGAESPIEDDDLEEDEDDEEEEQEEDDDIDDADEVDPRDFEEEMGQGLDDKRPTDVDEDMDD